MTDIASCSESDIERLSAPLIVLHLSSRVSFHRWRSREFSLRSNCHVSRKPRSRSLRRKRLTLQFSRRHRCLRCSAPREQKRNGTIGGFCTRTRLLGDLRFRLNAEVSRDAPYVTRSFANANGVFHVPDAATALDEDGRRVIPADDFVQSERIARVFGFGGAYVLQQTFVSTILFTREHVTRTTAMHFLPLSSAFKAATQSL